MLEQSRPVFLETRFVCVCVCIFCPIFGDDGVDMMCHNASYYPFSCTLHFHHNAWFKPTEKKTHWSSWMSNGNYIIYLPNRQHKNHRKEGAEKDREMTKSFNTIIIPHNEYDLDWVQWIQRALSKCRAKRHNVKKKTIREKIYQNCMILVTVNGKKKQRQRKWNIHFFIVCLLHHPFYFITP